MADRPLLWAVYGREAPVTACLLSQILAGRGRAGLAALTEGFRGGAEGLLEELGRAGCRYVAAALPERPGALRRRADTAVILTCGTGEAAGELMAGCGQAVVNLDDPDAACLPRPPGRVWTYSERRDEADLTAKNLRLLPFCTEFEAVTWGDIRRLSVPLPDGRGLYPGLAAACAALSFGIGLGEIARRLQGAGPVPSGMVPLAGGGPFAAAGYFDFQPLPPPELDSGAAGG